MPHYILSGRTETELLNAESAKAVIAAFRQAGFEEVVLHTDEAMAATIDPDSFKHGVTPKLFFEFGKTPNTFSTRFRQFFTLSFPWWRWTALAMVILCLVALTGFPFLAGVPGFDLASVATRFYLTVLFVAVFAAAVAIARLRSRPYDRFIEAAAWGRSEEVLRLLPRVRRIFGSNKLVQADLTFREATALAALGRLDEALEVAQTVFEDVPAWMFWGRLAEVFLVAGRKEEQLAAMERSVELAPDNATCLLDLALTLTRMRRDLGRARSIFEQATHLPISEAIQPFVTLADGMITLEEGDATRAIPLLLQSMEEMKPFASANALVGLIQDRTKAYLALAYHATKDYDRTLEYFRAAESRLAAIRSMHDLRDRCLRELRCAPPTGGGV